MKSTYKTALGIACLLVSLGMLGRIPHAAGAEPAGATGQFYYCSRTHDAKSITLVRCGLDGRDPKNITDDAVTAKSVSWTADQSRVVCYRVGIVEHRFRQELLVMDGDGANLKKYDIDPNYLPVGSPRLLNGGKQVGFSAQRSKEALRVPAGKPGAPEPVIAVLDLASGKVRELGRGIAPCWSPDGKKILVSHFDLHVPVKQGMRLALADASGKEIKNIADGACCGEFSPSGDRIAYVQIGEGRSQIMLAAGDGSGAAILSTGVKVNISPRWLPDGKTIEFMDDSGLMGCVWAVGTDGTGARQISPAGQGAWIAEIDINIAENVKSPPK